MFCTPRLQLTAARRQCHSMFLPKRIVQASHNFSIAIELVMSSRGAQRVSEIEHPFSNSANFFGPGIGTARRSCFGTAQIAARTYGLSSSRDSGFFDAHFGPTKRSWNWGRKCEGFKRKPWPPFSFYSFAIPQLCHVKRRRLPCGNGGITASHWCRQAEWRFASIWMNHPSACTKLIAAV